MDPDYAKLLQFFKGKRVKLTLKSSSYVGVVQRINLNKTLVLADVVSNGSQITGSKLFFGHEILNVEFPNEANTDSGNIEEHLNVETFQPHMKTISFDGDEEHVNFIVIDEFHKKFGSAVMHIKGQHVIGVGADGVEMFNRLCWLQIATKKKVYLFDILVLGDRAFKNGLSMILENTRILKVIHDCRAIAGCLSAQFGVKLSNVFDTQVADVMGFSSETGGLLPNRVSTLQEVVSLHLKEERELLYKRPCPIPLLKVMALSVIHLLPLRLVLLDTLMIDYVALVDSYLKSSFYEPDELPRHVGMESVFELLRELRQLGQMRQERAADHYAVTEHGLLDRFSPRSPSPSQSPPAEGNVDPPSSPPRAGDGFSVDVDRPAVPLDSSELRKRSAASAPASPAAGRGSTEVLMDTTGGGSASGGTPASWGFGRGFLLPVSQDEKPTQRMGAVTNPGRMGQLLLATTSDAGAWPQRD